MNLSLDTVKNDGRWFQRLLAELNFELWVGDAAEIRAKRVGKQRNDRVGAQPILKLMLEENFSPIWVPTPENRDLRQLILHRHRLVGMRTRVMNQQQAIAMNEGVRRKEGGGAKKGGNSWNPCRCSESGRCQRQQYWSAATGI